MKRWLRYQLEDAAKIAVVLGGLGLAAAFMWGVVNGLHALFS